MGQHRSLRPTGGAGGVEHAGDVVGLPLDHPTQGGDLGCGVGQRAAAVVAEGEGSLDVGDVGNRLQLAGQVGRVDEDGGLGVAEEEPDLVGGVGGVEWHVDEPGPHAGEVQGDGVDRLVDLDNPVARLGTAIGQDGGHGRTPTIELPVGVGVAVGKCQERIVPVLPELGREELIDVVTQRCCTMSLSPGAQLPPSAQD